MLTADEISREYHIILAVSLLDRRHIGTAVG